MSSLASLRRDFPLPPGWAEPEVFDQEFRLGSLRLQLVGLAAKHEKRSEEAVGSSAALGQEFDRAYFELLERCLTLDAIQDSTTDFPALCAEGRPAGPAIPRNQVFPVESPGAAWKNARSNGIALHQNFRQAAERALRELTERDLVLRSWFGETKPVPVPLADQNLPGLPALTECFDLSAYLFPERSGAEDPGIFVTGIFGFPKQSGLPTIFGFGAHRELSAALEHSLGEAFQRLGFVYDSDFQPQTPLTAAEPSADFHLAWYLQAHSGNLLTDWLKGAHWRSNGAAPAPSLPVRFVELTSQPSYSLVKALQPSRLPLRFGLGYGEFYPNVSNLERAIHPIA